MEALDVSSHGCPGKKMCESKETGGLGFHDICRFNQALLGKRAWRILSRPDSLSYIKCNVGTAWNESNIMCGASWITRDAQRVPLHHSRRAFPSPVSKREAALQALLWAIEAMDNMKQRNVIFETSSVEVRDVLLNVSHFPELKYLTDHLPRLLQGLGDWSLNHVFSSKNKVAFAIAESVINHHLSQSYVVLGGPRWLAQTVQQESRSV